MKYGVWYDGLANGSIDFAGWCESEDDEDEPALFDTPEEARASCWFHYCDTPREHYSVRPYKEGSK